MKIIILFILCQSISFAQTHSCLDEYYSQKSNKNSKTLRILKELKTINEKIISKYKLVSSEFGASAHDQISMLEISQIYNILNTSSVFMNFLSKIIGIDNLGNQSLVVAQFIKFNNENIIQEDSETYYNYFCECNEQGDFKLLKINTIIKIFSEEFKR